MFQRMDFATFAPSNATAHRLLRQAINHLTQIESGQISLRLLQDADSTHNTDDTGARHKTSDFEEPCYVLSFEDGKLPHNPQRGWVVGCSSRTSDTGPIKVDFLVAKPYGRDQEATIAPTHLVLRINRAGILTFTPASKDHEVEVLMNAKYERIRFGQDRAIISALTVLRLGGRAVYNLLFSVDERNLNSYLERLSEISNDPTDDRLIRFVPSIKSRVFAKSGICINTGTLSAGAFGWVSEGYTLDGEPVAIKAFTVTRKDQYKTIEAEFRVASVFENAKYVTQALKIWCEHDQDLSQGSCPSCAEVRYRRIDLYISARLARGSFLDILGPNNLPINLHDRIQLFNQSFRGLAEIWSMGFIHRDITLQNLLVDSIKPPKASITDFGKAIQCGSEKLYDTRIGPIPYVAPEVWIRQGYGRSIDLFSLALSIALLYMEPPWWPDNKVTEEKLNLYNRKLQELGQQQPPLNALMNLLCSILRWRVEDRINLELALKHRCWDGIKVENTGGEELGHKRLKMQDLTDSKSHGENDRSFTGGSVVTQPFSSGFYEAE